MKKVLRKAFGPIMCMCAPCLSYASMVMGDTLLPTNNVSVFIPSVSSQYVSTAGLGVENLYVDKIKSQNNASSILMSDVSISNGLIIKQDGPADTELPSFEIWSSFESTKPRFTVQFDSDYKNGLNASTLSRGYCVPVNFEASEYNFNFYRGAGAEDTLAVFRVNGKIVCKEELKVVEVNTEKIKANKIEVDFNHAADYVFDDNYDLKSLSDLEAYVKENKHLPGIPSAEEFSERGMNVSDVTNMLLEKIEELTLHVIQLQKELNELKAKNE